MTVGQAPFASGSLVRARGREWVVLPNSEPDLLMVRPLGGSDEEITGIYLPLEPVEPASFAPPDPDDLGDYRSCRLLHEALRLRIRSSAGPFRCFGSLAVEPRPYQVVPLLMAMRMDPVRLLVADDVGVGKTVEAALIARELLDRGDAHGLAVLCPPHLAEQWQRELSDKFSLEAELVLPATAARLERDLPIGASLFDRHPIVVVSTDYIKADRRREEFLLKAPDLVIVDEAHTCTDASARRGGRHQRYRLVSGLAAKRSRHLILVTATPHSGKEEAFRSLVGFLDPAFATLPDDLSREELRAERRRLARQLVQRRRADIRHYMEAETPFPDRLSTEQTYTLSPDYKRFFERAIAYAQQSVATPSTNEVHRRVLRWSALALLRSIGSSPAAAAATFRTRAQTADALSAAEADDIGRRSVLDLVDDETDEGTDVTPGAEPGGIGEPEHAARRRLLGLAKDAEALTGPTDRKLTEAVGIVKALVNEGHRPIVFCRFIATADYVRDELRKKLPADVEVVAVTGRLVPDEREASVQALAASPKRVLVATDCLSEGVNLQAWFDAVVHYDLSWNPTRHEQREGRVDRYGQPETSVRVVTFYGRDNPIDGIVLDVLLRKHERIRSSLGVSVPVPVDSNAVLEAILDGLLVRNRPDAGVVDQLALFEELLAPERDALHAEWDSAVERERRSQTVFAQEAIGLDEVRRELAAAREAVGSAVDVSRFAGDVLAGNGAAITRRDGTLEAELTGVAQSFRDIVGLPDGRRFIARTESPTSAGQVLLTRTHPIVDGLAAHVLDTALDPLLPSIARRAGAIRTRGVSSRTVALLLRVRYDVSTRRTGGGPTTQLAEESQIVAFTGSPENPTWLPPDEATTLLDVEPTGNVPAPLASDSVRAVLEGLDDLRPHLERFAVERAETLRAAHDRIRAEAHITGIQTEVAPKLPVDVLGIYIYLPVAGGAA